MSDDHECRAWRASYGLGTLDFARLLSQSVGVFLAERMRPESLGGISYGSIRLLFCHVFPIAPFFKMLCTPFFRSTARLGRHAKWPSGARQFNATTRRKAEVQLTVDGKQVSIEGPGYC